MALGTQMQKFAEQDSFHIPSFNELRLQGWSIIGTNPANPVSSLSKTLSTSDYTTKSQHIAACDATQIALLFSNWASIQPGQSIQPNYQAITAGASLQKAGTNSADETGLLQPVFFKNGKNKITLDPAALVTSEPAFFNVAKNERFYIRTYMSCALPPAPSTPTITPNASGGFLVNTFTYYVILKYVFADGVESATSSYGSAIIASATNVGTITVTAPAAAAGAFGYKVYMTQRTYSGSPTTALYNPVSGIVPFGQDFTIFQEPSVNDYRYAKQGGPLYTIGGGGLLGGSAASADAMDTGEGFRQGNDLTLTTQTNQSIQQGTYTNLYWAIAILGRTKTPQKSVGLIGDSIQAGTGDCGYSYNNGGFATRAICNQLSLSFDTAANPYYGYVRVPLGGESAAQFALTLSNNQFFRGRAAVTELATNIICNYGTNDVSGSTTTLKTNLLAIAKWYMVRGIKFFQCTLLPKTSSTDGFLTANNQTTVVETNRLVINTWLRDSTSTGFIAQANTAAGTTGLAAVIDVCKYVEVNSSNTLTQDGGFWRIPTGITPVTGTLTSVAAAYDFTDNTKTWVRNAYKGWDFIMTSGTQINKRYNIGYNTAAGNINTYFNTIGGTPAIGDAYKITVLGTIDGTHPSSQGHIWMAQAVQEVFTQFI